MGLDLLKEMALRYQICNGLIYKILLVKRLDGTRKKIGGGCKA